MLNIDKIIGFIASRYRLILVIILLITIPLTYYFTKQEHFNHIEIYYDKDDHELSLYKKSQKIYGNEEQLVIVFKEEDIFTAENIELIRKMTESITRLEGVQRVFSLTNIKEAAGHDDTVSFERIVPEKNLNDRVLSDAKKKALSNKYVVNQLISKDGKAATIFIEIKPLFDKEKGELLEKIRKCSKDIAGEKIRLYYGGLPFAENELNSLSSRDFRTFTPFVFITIFIILLLMMRDTLLAVLGQLNLLLGIIWTIGIYVLCGEKFNIITVIMGGVLLAVTIANCIHYLSQLKDEYAHTSNHKEAAVSAFKHVWFPCLMTTLTNTVGFISFLTSTIRPVMILGVYTSLGVLLAFIITMTFLPASVILLGRRSFNKNTLKKKSNPAHDTVNLTVKHEGEDSWGMFNRAMLKLGEFTTSRYKILTLLFVIIMAVSIAGIFRMTYETNSVNFLPESNKIRTDIEFIENNIGGTIPYVILVKAKSEEYDFTHTDSLLLIDKIQTDLMKKIPNFTSSFSVADYFKDIHKAFNGGNQAFFRIPEKRNDVLDYYELADDTIKRVISPDYMETKLSFQLKCKTNEEGNRVHSVLSNYMKSATKKGFSYEITGLSTLYADMTERLRMSQLTSFLAAFIVIFIMMYVVCRNMVLTVISMLPNLFPIAVTLGVMGWFAIPLDVVTDMIASITMGIAVDDTVHYMVGLRRNMATGIDLKSSLLKTFKDVGKPAVITSLILVLGFFVFVLGSITPTQTFGYMTALSMLVAISGDLVFLPAILLMAKPLLSRQLLNKKY